MIFTCKIHTDGAKVFMQLLLFFESINYPLFKVLRYPFALKTQQTDSLNGCLNHTVHRTAKSPIHILQRFKNKRYYSKFQLLLCILTDDDVLSARGFVVASVLPFEYLPSRFFSNQQIVSHVLTRGIQQLRNLDTRSLVRNLKVQNKYVEEA